ncbi:protein FAM91A1-like [Sorghum bicolor]|uniref:protein FAM91A1-like n=1 Tax=Sorghum bicolor TaxID=4558 RepID=UPI000B424C1D|nr:protein FAM91A1-like [Sorghum bicolor]|eukprot:XP_021302971.1 protein FAM91A1-like [Sorghum bicolor]
MQQQMAATVEEQMMVKAIREESPWEALPKRIQAALVSKEEWHRRIVDYCIRKRLPWSSCFARKICKEGEYYEDLMRYLRKNLAVCCPYFSSSLITQQFYDNLQRKEKDVSCFADI